MKIPARIILAALLVAGKLFSAAALAPESPTILVINSYNPEYEWTASQYSGIMEALETLDSEYIVYTEYLDWKRFPQEWHIRQMHDICKEKYLQRNIRLIITTDDRALQFAIDYRKELFSGAPIVFSGVYREDEEVLTAGETRITGVFEDIAVDDTLRYALSINPDIEKAYILSEETESGKRTEALIEDGLRRIMPGVATRSLSGLTIEQIESFVPTLEENAFLLLGSYSIEKGGKSYPTNVLARRISEASAVPVFSIFYHQFGSGTVGGRMLSGQLHGKKAGLLAGRIINGENADSIKPVSQDEYITSFDYNVLTRFDISLWSLPWDSVIINREVPFFDRYRTESIQLLVLFLLLIAFIYILLVMNRKTRILAFTDALTGLSNRTQIVKSAKKYLSATAKDRKFALLFLDLDNFKYVNDTFGHEIGDKALLHTAKRLETLETDRVKVARIGGDEFLILMINTTNREILDMTRTVEELSDGMMVIDDNELFLTISAGIAIYPDNADSFNALFRNAESAMHRAKSTGKLKHVFYDDSMSKEMRNWMELAAGLRTAIGAGELFVMYQPQINVKTGKLDGLEALVRWNHPRRGLVSPAEFIPVAEGCGQIDRIGMFVLRSACEFIKEADKTCSSKFTVSVNVSVKQLAQKNFADNLLKLTGEERIESGRISLEITESVLIDSMKDVKDALSVLVGAGFKISLDDFGTGYSSLTYLHQLPIDYIKMDKSFIDGMLTDPRSKPLTSSIIGISHELGLLVVAEGVENEEQVRFLDLNGCDLIQGYFFSKPKMPEEVLKMLELQFRPPTILR